VLTLLNLGGVDLSTAQRAPLRKMLCPASLTLKLRDQSFDEITDEDPSGADLVMPSAMHAQR